MAFAKPHDAWEHLKDGIGEMPSPLEGHVDIWRKIAERVDHDMVKGVVQLAPVIGGRRRYHHRPLTTWLLSTGKTLTLTTDPMEAKTWNAIVGKKNVALPRIYDTFSVKVEGASAPHLWAVLHERLRWPPDPDWEHFVDSFFRWRAMQKDALQPASPDDLEHFLRYVIDPEVADPITTQRKRIEHILPFKLTRSRRKEHTERREKIKTGPELEKQIAWAKSALKFLHANKIKFRDFDPSNLAKTKDGRTVITNLAESRSKPKRTGRGGRVHAQVLQAAASALAEAYRQNPQAVVALFTPKPLKADMFLGPGPEATAVMAPPTSHGRAIDVLLRTARYLERDAQALQDEYNMASPPDVNANALLALALAIEKQVKRLSQKIITLR